MDAKSKAILAHITIIGWLIALVANGEKREAFTSFYIRQTLGIYILIIILSLIPVLGWLLQIVTFILWLISLIGSIQGQMTSLPFLGPYFQQWFKSIQ